MTLQDIYNQWLASSRGNLNKPFKFKKDFTNFEKEEYYPYLIKIDNILQRNKDIVLRDYFDAPYKVYPEDKMSYPLQFYYTRKAISIYVKYKTLQEKNDKDTKLLQVDNNQHNTSQSTIQNNTI